MNALSWEALLESPSMLVQLHLVALIRDGLGEAFRLERGAVLAGSPLGAATYKLLSDLSVEAVYCGVLAVNNWVDAAGDAAAGLFHVETVVLCEAAALENACSIAELVQTCADMVRPSA